MACIINQGYTLPCASVGGIQKVYIGNYLNTAAYTFDADQIITAVTSPALGLNVYNFSGDIETAGLTQTISADRGNLTAFLETNITLKLHSFDEDTRTSLVQLMRAPLFVIVQSNAGEYYFAGVESAGRVTEGTASLGTMLSDLNGVELTINFKSKNGVYLLDADVIGDGVNVL